MLSLSGNARIYFCNEPISMLRSFEGLSQLVVSLFSEELTSGAYFVFINRYGDRMKVLYWDVDGYALWHKRLEAGSYRVTQVDEYEEITAIDMEDLLRGTDFSRIKLRKDVEKGSFDSL